MKQLLLGRDDERIHELHAQFLRVPVQTVSSPVLTYGPIMVLGARFDVYADRSLTSLIGSTAEAAGKPVFFDGEGNETIVIVPNGVCAIRTRTKLQAIVGDANAVDIPAWVSEARIALKQGGRISTPWYPTAMFSNGPINSNDELPSVSDGQMFDRWMYQRPFTDYNSSVYTLSQVGGRIMATGPASLPAILTGVGTRPTYGFAFDAKLNMIGSFFTMHQMWFIVGVANAWDGPTQINPPDVNHAIVFGPICPNSYESTPPSLIYSGAILAPTILADPNCFFGIIMPSQPGSSQFDVQFSRSDGIIFSRHSNLMNVGISYGAAS